MLYKTILADPPWSYQQKLGRGKKEGDTTRGGVPYSTMTLEQIASLPIQTLADDHCMLFLWTTNSHIHEALHVMEKWGFEYKTTITWVKNQIGLGYWFRGQTEHLLFGVRGNPRSKLKGPHGATGKALSTVIFAKREGHSKKPSIVYKMIEDISEEPRLELFARARRFGWQVWGNEVKSDISLSLRVCSINSKGVLK